MSEKAIKSLEERLKASEQRLEAAEQKMCEQSAFIHALEALTVHIMTDHGVDEEAVKASLDSLLHQQPKTGQTAQKRADYLINLKRLDRSAALYSSGRSKPAAG